MAIKVGTKKVPLAAVVEDFSLYPRNKVNDFNISGLVQALKAEQELPAIILDADSMRIIDGFHRCRATVKQLGQEGVIRAELWRYESEAERFLDAARRNATHGAQLTSYDRSRITLRASELGITEQQVSVALAMPVAKVRELAVHVVVTPAGREPSKPIVAHMDGREVTEAQAQVIRRAPGSRVSAHVRTLGDLLREDLIDPDDARLHQELRELAGLLEGWLATKTTEAA